MSYLTKPTQRQLMIYQVYVRNHTKEGTFKALIKDLDRIKALGTDVVYLLPVHPIGKVNRKGELGSPYAISDYYKINEELGTLADFKALIKAVHKKGMKIMMDIVFNHTAVDSLLREEHPAFFYRDKDGNFANRAGEWVDVIDFDFSNDPKLSEYLLDNLLYWQELGVDGYRFDVASLLPLDFLIKARDVLKKKDKDFILLSESVHESFVKQVRDLGFECLSESEVYQAFDMAYDYDTHPEFEAFVKGEGSLKEYIKMLNKQDAIYPKNYVKMRNLENHDFGRIAGYLDEDPSLIKQWHAFNFFSKGATMIFGGGEFSNPHHPDLFNNDTITRDGEDISDLIQKLATYTKSSLFVDGVYDLTATDNEVIVGSYTLNDKQVVGIFNVSKASGKVDVPVIDGVYKDVIYGDEIHVKDGKVFLTNYPIIFEV